MTSLSPSVYSADTFVCRVCSVSTTTPGDRQLTTNYSTCDGTVANAALPAPAVPDDWVTYLFHIISEIIVHLVLTGHKP